MGKINRLSEEEKERRLQLLERYDRWSEGAAAPSLALYCAVTGDDHSYLARCVKWRTSLQPTNQASAKGFVRLDAVGGRNGEPVRVSVGNVSIEVGPTSSKEALAMVLATLGVNCVL